MISVMYVYTCTCTYVYTWPAETALVECNNYVVLLHCTFLLLQGQTTDALSKLLSLQPSDAVLLTYEDGNLVKYNVCDYYFSSC